MGDLNGDGFEDLVVNNGAQELLNKGDGTFNPAVTLPTRTARSPVCGWMNGGPMPLGMVLKAKTRPASAALVLTRFAIDSNAVIFAAVAVWQAKPSPSRASS